MIQKHCDVPGCGRKITGHNLARIPAKVSVPGLGLASVSFNFSGRTPDVCNPCMLAAVATLESLNETAEVIPLAGRKSKQ